MTSHKSVKRLLLGLLLPAIMWAQCSKGCLKCAGFSSSLNKCEICDFFNNFVQDQKQRCLLKNIPNCERYNYSGVVPETCIRCKPGHFFQTSSETCEAVPPERVVPFCDYYDLNINCSRCQFKYFKSEGRCVAVGLEIPNCKEYLGKFSCGLCEDGFWFNRNSGLCERISSVANCKVYGRAKCLRCAENYLVTPNQIHFIEEKNLLHNQLFLQELFVSKEVFASRPKLSECRRVTVQGCKSFISFDRCRECQEGHFLTAEATCTPFPEDRIDHCQDYSSASICKKCVNGYFLSSNQCFPSTAVPNCLKYDPLSDSCVQCSDAFLLGKTQDCERRLFFPVPNCLKLAVSLDKCEVCLENYRLTNDEIGCFRLIQNCQNYHDVYASSSTKNACSICAEGFYPSDDGRPDQGSSASCSTPIIARSIS